MANMAFSLEEFSFGGVHVKYSSSIKGFESVEGENMGKQIHFHGGEDWRKTGGIDSFCSDSGLYQDDSSEERFLFPKCQQQEQQQQSFSDYGLLDDLRFDIATPPIQTCLEEIAKLDGIQTGSQDVESKKEKQFPLSLASLELLKNYGNGFKRLTGERIIKPSNDASCAKVESRKFSTEDIIRFAGERFIQSASQDGLSMLNHPSDLSFSGLSKEETQDVELAEFLLASAEKVGYQQFERASRLLNQCDYLSSNSGNPVERVVYYFSEALRERIDRETRGVTSKGLGEKMSLGIDEGMVNPNSITLACHQEMPFSQVTHFTAIQAILENVAESKKIHIIDLAIRNGVQWTVLMQALASRYECPVELLKITAIGTNEKELIGDTGKRLASFAETLNIPFVFKIVMVPDMLDLKEELFELDAEETVAVLSQFLLKTMIALPNRLDTIMRVIRNINPCIMVVAEVEANHNSPNFVGRFVETLFFYTAFFDYLEACLERDDPNRLITESRYFSQGIRNIVAAEGEERKIRNVKIDVWREFFERFGMKELELSMSSSYQANMVVKRFACGSSCTLDMNGKSLIIGWKGTPVHSVSVWKFLSQEQKEVEM